MPNIETIINNINSVTIDISAITDEQRRLLKLSINYQDQIPDEDGQMINNPMPLIVALLADSMEKRKMDVWKILEREKMVEAQEAIAEVVGSL